MPFPLLYMLGTLVGLILGRRRLNMSHARKEFSKSNLYLLDETYISSSASASYRCEVCLYRGTSSLNRVKSGHGCPKCVKKLKPTVEEVKVEFSVAGFSLLSETYINSKERLNCRCNVCGFVGFKCLNAIKRGQGCPVCTNVFKKDIEYAKQSFSSLGLVLLCDTYINNKHKMLYRCRRCLYRGEKRLNDVLEGKGCPTCAVGGVSKVEIEWLDFIGVPDRLGVTRQVPLNLQDGTKYKVDGFDPETNTVYEFLGDYWHGNPEIYKPQDINPTSKKTYGELFLSTKEKINKLTCSGYKVIYIWEKEFTSWSK